MITKGLPASLGGLSWRLNAQHSSNFTHNSSPTDWGLETAGQAQDDPQWCSRMESIHATISSLYNFHMDASYGKKKQNILLINYFLIIQTRFSFTLEISTSKNNLFRMVSSENSIILSWKGKCRLIYQVYTLSILLIKDKTCHHYIFFTPNKMKVISYRQKNMPYKTKVIKNGRSIENKWRSQFPWKHCADYESIVHQQVKTYQAESGWILEG